MKSHISAISSDYGSVREYKYSMPGGADEVCFVDDKTAMSSDAVDDEVIKAALLSEIPEQVFLRKNKQTQEKLDVGKIYMTDEVPNHFCCVPVKAGLLTLRLEGLGNKARLIVPECAVS